MRPLYEWQKGKNDSDYGNANRTGTQGLIFIEKNYSRPVNYYIYGGGGSGYYQASTIDEGASINNLWDMGEFVPANFAIPKLEYSSFITSAFGIKRIVYEGGPSFGDQNGAGGMNALAPQALQDSRIKDEIISHQNIWTQYGGDLFTFFVLGGDERWGFFQHPTHSNSYKMQGIDAIKNAPAQAVAIGYPIQMSGTTMIRGDRWMVSNRDNGGTNWRNSTLSDDEFSLSSGVWVSYPFHVIENGNYEVRLRYKTTGNNTSKAVLGGNTLGILSLSNTNGQLAYTEWLPFSTIVFDATSIRIWNQSGANLIIDQIEFKLAGALPISLISFDGIRKDDTNVLNWIVAQEINVEKYEIEYSENGIYWEIAGTIHELNFNKVYQFKHNTKMPSVFYRLKIIDFDSQISYSNVIHIFFIKNDKAWKVLSNPATESFILYGDEYCEDCFIYVKDVMGRILHFEKLEATKLSININTWHSGQYYYTVVNEKGFLFSGKFNKI
ncbi:MAG: hypothetical protein IPK35_17335 [Saprospiraceae bacterium]|nr:hypothetical protein [Saprospiraceae bacterium]